MRALLLDNKNDRDPGAVHAPHCDVIIALDLRNHVGTLSDEVTTITSDVHRCCYLKIGARV